MYYTHKCIVVMVGDIGEYDNNNDNLMLFC